MEVGSVSVAPHIGAPDMTPRQRSRQHVDGPARALLVGHPVVDHDAAADPPITTRIDFLA